MQDVLIFVAMLACLLVLDLAATRFGVDTREPPDAWW